MGYAFTSLPASSLPSYPASHLTTRSVFTGLRASTSPCGLSYTFLGTPIPSFLYSALASNRSRAQVCPTGWNRIGG